MVHIHQLLFLLLFSASAFGQQFYADGSMKLSEIASSKQYGYEPDAQYSIKVGTIANQSAYLNSLLGPNGENVKYRRLGSCCAFESKKAILGMGLLDKYEVKYEGQQQSVILYLNGYDYEDPKCPQGFTYKSPEKIEVPVRYPEDSIVKATACNGKQMYSVDESLLKENTGELPKPDSSPSFKEGEEALKKYFAENPLTDERAEMIVFRVIIGFIVDCKGQSGNYRIISKGKGTLESLANQVLERVNKMPREWEPARKDGNAVDCFQVISFTIRSGDFVSVSVKKD
jgi:hypothetical protein